MKITNKLKEAAQKFRNEMNQIKAQQKTLDQVEVEPGQVWIVRFGDEATEATFALTLSKPFDDGSGGVRIAPIHCSPINAHICQETDIVVSGREFPTKITSLVEWWNDRPINVVQLKAMIGVLEASEFERVKTMLKNRPESTSTNPNVRLFRLEQLEIGNLISAPHFKELLS